MRTAWILTLLVATALAGCSGADMEPQPTQQTDPGTSTTQTTSTTTSATSTSTTSAPAPQNTPPEAVLAADVTNGTAPLNVTFTLDGSDADGDALTWSFDADGDGTAEAEGDALPATWNHTYGPGNVTARLSVSDGVAQATSDLEITVADGAPAFAPLRLFYRGTGPVPVDDPAPTGVGIEGTLEAEAGSTAKAVLTTGPVASIAESDGPGGELVLFQSAPLTDDLLILTDTEEVSDRTGTAWSVATGATMHTCLRGGANGVFSAKILRVLADGTEELVLQNNGRQFAGQLATEGCTEHRLSFVDGVEPFFPAGSSIKVIAWPDQFLASPATELLFNGGDAPHDSSLDLVAAWL